MRCSHCTIAFHANWEEGNVLRSGFQTTEWQYRTAFCPACRELIIEFGKEPSTSSTVRESDWKVLYPAAGLRGPVPPDVPADVAIDYIEACNVLHLSAKASAALSRRCLQLMLRAHGYKARDLAQEVQALLDEADPRKAISPSLRAAVDGIRNFGNFSAHPITDVTTLQIIDVEPVEAEWCLETIEEAFQHFYVRPAEALRRKAQLDAKLASAGKPPSK